MLLLYPLMRSTLSWLCHVIAAVLFQCTYKRSTVAPYGEDTVFMDLFYRRAMLQWATNVVVVVFIP